MRLPAPFEFLRRTRVWQALRDARYLRRHRSRCDFYRALLPPGALVFDIGANVGHYAVIFHHLGARVVAVEPQAELAAGLRRRFRTRPGIEIVQSALGAAPARALLHKTADLSEIASLRPDVADRSRFAAEHPYSLAESVPVVTLDSLIARTGVPDFCKVDVEGYEHEVFAGLTQPLPLCSFEFNREYWEVAVNCVARLASLGTYRFNYALGESAAFALADWAEGALVLAELAQNPDPLLWGDIYARRIPPGPAAGTAPVASRP
ncbi:MAG: FkbM family methyltransferase [Verrucomicrobia bacterium]|nr:FkbM family methyltransferase [Verrucomicrobiota bacterium]